MAAWTTEEDAVIRELAKTHSAAQIAQRLPGRSRASVVGRAWRLGMSLAKDEATRLELEHPHRKRARRDSCPPRFAAATMEAWPQTPEPVRRAALAVQPRLMLLEQLSGNHCRWPYGEAEVRFCGRPRVDAAPYCGPHRALAYQPETAPVDVEALAAFLRGRDRVQEAAKPAEAA